MKKIEEYSLNAWPALTTLLLDGWLLRFAEGYTKRANSIQAIYSGENEYSMDEKISQCELQYSQQGLDTIFKITPFVPENLDQVLLERSYELKEPSSVQVLSSLDAIKEPSILTVSFSSHLTEEWLDVSDLTPANEQVITQMLGRLPLNKGFFILYNESVPVASGLGVIEQDYVGLYDIVTVPAYRNQGYGEQLILNILAWAKKQGATKGYLQVVQSNAPAIRLYEKLNYVEVYTYWYRCKSRQRID